MYLLVVLTSNLYLLVALIHEKSSSEMMGFFHGNKSLAGVVK